MKLDYNVKLTQEQKIILSQNMQESIKLLQMSMHDLREYINNQYSENPILEVHDNNFELKECSMKNSDEYTSKIKKALQNSDDEYKIKSEYNYNSNEEVSPFNFIEKKKSLKEYLKEQLIEVGEDQYILQIADYIIESLDSKGYLEIPISEIADELKISIKDAEEGLKIVQGLEPYGIGARNVKECLLIQSLKLNILDDTVEKIILEYLPDIAENKYKEIAKKLNISPTEAQRYGDLIKGLEPKPSRGFYTGDDVNYIIPDAEVKLIDNKFFIIMNDDMLPKLSINKTYRQALNDNLDEKTNDYVKEKMNQAVFLIKSIEQRKNTLYRVIESLTEKQKEFFYKGSEYIKTLTLKDIADSLNLSESTISRAIKDKYILTDYGTISLKKLFASGTKNNGEGIASIHIKSKIKSIISKEEKSNPLCDEKISSILKEENINISRRTVAKYREELGIKSSSKRKRI